MAAPARTEKKTGTAGRKRAAHLGPERRRPEVLDAALKLFLERGYEGTSMEAIARAAGVTKPVVYDRAYGVGVIRRAQQHPSAQQRRRDQRRDREQPPPYQAPCPDRQTLPSRSR